MTGWTRYTRALVWLVPPVVFLWVQWPSLQSYFFADDFAWLQLPRMMNEGKSLWELIFAPTAHGTWRPFSERLTFFVFHSLFPADPLPFRVLTALTQLGSIALLSAIMLRLTGSRLAAAAAPIFWVAHMNPTQTFAWNSAYMQVLCGFCLLSAFYFFLRYDESGSRRFLAGHWAVFLFGFTVMETNLMLPALTAPYCLLRARRRWRLVAAQAAVSAAFVALHLWLAPKHRAGTYSLHLDPASLVQSFAQYAEWTVYPRGVAAILKVSDAVCRSWSIAAGAALIAFALWTLWRRDWRTPIFLCWYLALMAPVLPLREHLTPYYLTLATMGAGMLAAWALAWAWRAGPAWRAVALALLAGWLGLMPPAARAEAKWWRDLSRDVRSTVSKLRAIQQASPGKVLVVTGVSERDYGQAIAHDAARAVGPRYVFMAPDTAEHVPAGGELGDTSQNFADDATLRSRLESGEAAVYSLAGPRPVNVSARTLALMRTNSYAPPPMIDVAGERNAQWLRDGWYEIDGAHRWTAGRAAVVLFGPHRSVRRVTLRGYCPDVPEWPRAIEIRLEASRIPLAPMRLDACKGPFSVSTNIPAAVGLRHRTVLRLEVNPVFRAPGDERTLGLCLRQVGIE